MTFADAFPATCFGLLMAEEKSNPFGLLMDEPAVAILLVDLELSSFSD